MTEVLTHRLGTVTKKEIQENFDKFYDRFKKQAIEKGFDGKLLFKKEKGKIVIFVEI